MSKDHLYIKTTFSYPRGGHIRQVSLYSQKFILGTITLGMYISARDKEVQVGKNMARPTVYIVYCSFIIAYGGMNDLKKYEHTSIHHRTSLSTKV